LIRQHHQLLAALHAHVITAAELVDVHTTPPCPANECPYLADELM